MSGAKRALWDDFCRTQRVAERAVPLFAATAGAVIARPYGRDNRLILQRSPQMEALLIAETTTLLRDLCWLKKRPSASRGAPGGLLGATTARHRVARP